MQRTARGKNAAASACAPSRSGARRANALRALRGSEGGGATKTNPSSESRACSLASRSYNRAAASPPLLSLLMHRRKKLGPGGEGGELWENRHKFEAEMWSSAWMSALSALLHPLPLLHLAVPGTHDSAASALIDSWQPGTPEWAEALAFGTRDRHRAAVHRGFSDSDENCAVLVGMPAAEEEGLPVYATARRWFRAQPDESSILDQLHVRRRPLLACPVF